MGNHIMKTTINLSDDLARKAKTFAARKNTTLRAIIEHGIRQVLREDRTAGKFVIRDVSVRGKGLHKEYEDAGWAKIREDAYKGRGS